MVYRVKTIQELWTFLDALDVNQKHHIPLCKILFSLERKGFLQTVILQDADSEQLADECRFQKRPVEKCRRLHFFKGDPVGEASPDGYGGYCDLRADGTVAEAFITTKTVRNAPSDSYAFLPCAFRRSCTVRLSDTHQKDFAVDGFYYMEKNNRETMCAQAALYGVVRYWQEKEPGLFKGIASTAEINRQAGVNEDDPVLLAGSGRGLDGREIQNFFGKHHMPCWTRDYTHLSPNVVRRERVLQDIYGFVESGMPVIAGIKTDNGMHMLTIIGHTFDKNGWRAMADVGYFEPKDSHVKDYLPNVTWVENLIILDDNFGPYYFFPSRDIESMIAALFVPVPVGNIIRPHEALQLAVASTLFSQLFGEALQALFRDEHVRLFEKNQRWFDVFFQHLDVGCGDGLVLRPVLQRGEQVVEAYRGHEFCDTLTSFLQCFDQTEYYWMVELSWPDVFCFRQARCGAVIFSASDSGALKQLVLHLPGILLFQTDGALLHQVAGLEDPPHPHLKPGK